MDDELRKLTWDMTFNSGAPEAALRLLQEATLGKLPPDYFDFLRDSNGAMGNVGNNYLALIPAEEVLVHNTALETASFAPGLIIFADDGADTAYAFDTLEEGAPIVDVPYVGMSRQEAMEIARTFREFLQYLATGGGFKMDS